MMTTNAEREKSNRPRVLVVEDNPENRFLLEKILRGTCRVDLAPGPEEVLKNYRVGDYDLLVVDIRLSNRLDGFDLVEELRKNHAPDDLPILGMTAHNTRGKEEKFQEAGFNDFFEKPFDPHKIRELIHTALDPDRPE